jgi:hypothetical protein
LIQSIEDLEAWAISSVVGIFQEEQPNNPIQVALKTDGDQWALAGLKDPWSTEALFDSAVRDRCFISAMWSAQPE